MSLGDFLATSEHLSQVKHKSWKFGRAYVLDVGMNYYREHPTAVEQIASNMARVGLSNGEDDVQQVCEHIVLHYFEKLFALVKRYEAFWICRHRMDVPPESLAPFEEAKREGKAVFVGQSHFGATYLLGSVLTTRGYDISMVGRFPDPVGSMLRETSSFFHSQYNTGVLSLINLADSNCDAPMEMLRAFMTGKIISNVFDENNAFSRPVSFMGQTIFGGSGMDMLLKNFNDDRVVLVTPFLIRTGDDRFRYEVERHYFKNGDIIQQFYSALETKVRAYPSQWYFLHELHESFKNKASPEL